jgi:hypothetical protein
MILEVLIKVFVSILVNTIIADLIIFKISMLATDIFSGASLLIVEGIVSQQKNVTRWIF